MLDSTHDKYIHFGGLKPIAKAYGVVGFIRFLNCYYLTLITKRAKVGSIGGNGIYSIKATETYQIRSSEDDPKYQKSNRENSGDGEDRSSHPRTQSGDSQFTTGSNGSTTAPSSSSDGPGSVLVSMWNKGKRSVGLGRDDR